MIVFEVSGVLGVNGRPGGEIPAPVILRVTTRIASCLPGPDPSRNNELLHALRSMRRNAASLAHSSPFKDPHIVSSTPTAPLIRGQDAIGLIP